MNSVVPTLYTIFTKKIFFIFLFFSTLFSQDQLGDLNQDGTVDVIDIVRLVNIILETPPEPTDYELWAGDLNDDGDINVLDIMMIVSIIFNDSNSTEGQWINITPFDPIENENKGINGSFISAQEGWIYQTSTDVGHTLYHTFDGGDSWEIVYRIPDEPDYREYFLSLQFVNELFGVATIKYQQTSYPYEGFEYFIKTGDGGYNWEDLTDSTFMYHEGFNDLIINNFYFINDSTGFSSGPFDFENEKGRIYKTINAGENWIETNVPSLESILSIEEWKVNKFYFYDELYGWAVCSGPGFDGGMAWKTINGGETWEIAIEPGAPDLFDAHFIDENHGGIAGRNSFTSNVILTEDNFVNQSFNYINSFDILTKNICYQNHNLIWISGEPLLIFKSENGGESFDLFQDIHSSTDSPFSISSKMECFDDTMYLLGFPNILLKYIESN